MAVLARLLGIPSRVAVGYTAGTRVGHDRWEVSTSDAHAWPELYFQGAGWLRFEPTPAGSGGQATATGPAYTLPPVLAPPRAAGRPTTAAPPPTSRARPRPAAGPLAKLGELPGEVRGERAAASAGRPGAVLAASRPALAVLALVAPRPLRSVTGAGGAGGRAAGDRGGPRRPGWNCSTT